MDDSNQCPFCALSQQAAHPRVVKSNSSALLILDGFPVSEGHSLIIPRRHVSSFFKLTDEEQLGMLALLEEAKSHIDGSYHPDSYNIGINDGPAAGQTIPHCHMHLIPRYHEQGKDPRGGVRWVIPEKADYWSKS